MKRNKKICLFCNKKISLSNFDKHIKSCRKKKEKDWFVNNEGKYECKICGKTSTSCGIGNHVKYHYGYKNPKSNYRGCIAWNKGLTKETSTSIRKSVETFNMLRSTNG